MKFFNNLGVRKKLISVFLVVCIFMALIGVEGILSSSKINEGSKIMYSNDLVPFKLLEEIKGNINDINVNMLKIVFERERSKLDDQIKSIDDLTNEDTKLEKQYESLPDDLNAEIAKEEAKIYSDFKNDLAKYRDSRDKVIELMKANNYEEAVKIYDTQEESARVSVSNKLDQVIAINIKLAQQESLNNIARFNNVRNRILIYIV